MHIDRTEKYIELTSLPLADSLEKVKAEALDDGIPIIRPSVCGLLRFLMGYVRPVNILEVGTAVGFSALLMHEYAPQAHITTIENYEPRLIKAKENFAEYAGGENGRITLLEGDAEKILPTLQSESYDFVFLDSAKGQYINFLPELIRLLTPGGMLVSDNCLQDGDVIESRYAVRRRDRTIHDRMRMYLSEVASNPNLTSAILPMADGVTVSYKAGGTNEQ
ncbi:MAG: O-methyltransferase [Lachnospiraceae bacterium]|nr:O-methyltransferase [Lachnospiraceae bacterium]